LFALIGAILFAIIVIMTLLVACGLPLGEFTMGGQNKILPNKYRIMAVSSLFIQVFAIIIILQAGQYITLWFSHNITKYICFFFAVYLTINIFMNISSKSKKERYVMTPLSLIAAFCFWFTAIKM